MEQQIICFFIDYRGHHRKGVAIYSTLKSIYNKNLGFIEVFLNTTKRFKTRKTNIFMVMGKFF
jgi:hypothetical protein